MRIVSFHNFRLKLVRIISHYLPGDVNQVILETIAALQPICRLDKQLPRLYHLPRIIMLYGIYSPVTTHI